MNIVNSTANQGCVFSCLTAQKGDIMKKKHTVIALIMALAMACSMVAQAGFTPRYEIDMPEIPDIEVTLSDELKEAVKQAAQKQLEKMVLEQPVITYASYWQSTQKYEYAIATIAWDKVEDATSYKIEITKPDGTAKTYEIKYNVLPVNSYNDDFVKSNMDGATVRVRAFGDDETYSMWSETVEIYCFNLK